MSASLYERLGETPGLTRIVDDVITAHLANPLIKTRFEQIKDLNAVKKVVVDFMCAGSGGPVAYTGKDMRSAHKGMNISEQEYLAVVDDIMYALNKNLIDDETKRDVLSIAYSLKGEIIRV